jgi:hypothetical protein
MRRVVITLVLIYFFTGQLIVSAFNSSSYIIKQDKYGNAIGSIKRIGNIHYETDKHGNVERTYKQIGDVIYIYDKNGNCIGSFRK